MGRQRTSYKNSLLYAKELIMGGKDIELACKLSAHRYDEKYKQIYRKLKKEERDKNKVKILFYEGPIYIVNVNDKKDIKKKDIAIKLNSKFEPDKAKLYIEHFYSKDNCRAIIKKTDWEEFLVFFNKDSEYNNYINSR